MKKKKKPAVIRGKMDDFIKLKSKDLGHGKIRKYEEVIKHKSDHENYKYI